MDSTLKKVLYVAGGALVVSSIVGFQKVSKVKAIFDAMEIKPDSFSKFDINFPKQEIRFNLNVLLKNTTNEDLYVTGVSLATVKQIIISYKNAYIATVNVNISEISIPAYDNLLIKNIPVKVAAINVLQNVTSLLDFDIKYMTCKAVIGVLNVEYLIGN